MRDKKVVKQNLIIFIVFMIVYVINRTTKLSHDIPYLSYILRNHFNDFLAGIVFLAYVNVVLEYSKYRQFKVLKLQYVLAVGLLAGLFWEYITPLYKANSTSDIIDVMCYVLGAGTYFVIMTIVMNRSKSQLYKAV